MPSRLSARLGLAAVAIILASCFGVLVASSRGTTIIQTDVPTESVEH